MGALAEQGPVTPVGMLLTTSPPRVLKEPPARSERVRRATWAVVELLAPAQHAQPPANVCAHRHSILP